MALRVSLLLSVRLRNLGSTSDVSTITSAPVVRRGWGWWSRWSLSSPSGPG